MYVPGQGAAHAEPNSRGRTVADGPRHLEVRKWDPDTITHALQVREGYLYVFTSSESESSGLGLAFFSFETRHDTVD